MSSSLGPDQATINRSDKLLNQALKRATVRIKELAAIKEEMTFPKITASLGMISAKIYTSNARQQTDIISRLPSEIRMTIWYYLLDDADRISLALSCKWNAHVFEQLKAIQKSRKGGNISVQHRLMVLVRLMTWMPGGQRLCFTCVRYCPRAKGTWGGDSKIEQAARYFDSGKRIGTDRNLKPTSSRSTIPKDAQVQGPRCPLCIQRVALDMVGFKPHHKELKALLKKHSF